MSTLVVALSAGSASASPTDTWVGLGAPLTGWSTDANWTSHLTADTPIDFPVLPDTGATSCGGSQPAGTCYTSTNDEGANFDVPSIAIDASTSYLINGQSIKLGAGGITDTVSGQPASSGGNTILDLPIVLTAPQTWSMSNQTGAQLDVDGGVTGTEDLQVNLADSATLAVGSDVEVGSVAVTGGTPSDTGPTANLNGSVVLSNNGQIDGTNSGAVGVTDAAISGVGTLGALTTTGADVSPGLNGAGALATASATLDSGSRVDFVVGSTGTTPGISNSELTSTGAVDLASAHLNTTFGTPTDCVVPVPGSTYTVVSTTGAVTGTFTDGAGNPLPQGALVPITTAAGCSPSSDSFQVSYNTSAAPETVTLTVVGPTDTTTAVTTDPTTVTQNGSVAYTAVVTPSSGVGVPTGTVNVTATVGVSTTALCTITLSGGTGTCSATTAPVGTDTITATYVPVSPFGASSGTTTLTVTPTGATVTSTVAMASPNPVVVNQPSTYSAEVTAVSGSAAPTAGTMVDFVAISGPMDDPVTTTLCTAPLLSSVTTTATASCGSTAAPEGTDTIMATYRGDPTPPGFAGSSGTTTQVVNPTPGPTPTSTTIQVSPTSQTFGQPVTYTATVTPLTGSSTPTGAVVFTTVDPSDNDPVSLCTAEPLVGGIASCSSSAAPVGALTVTGSYPGVTNLFDSSSGTTPLTITQPTGVTPSTTNITALPSTVNAGDTVTYTATVTPQTGPDTPVPTGSVSIVINSVQQCLAMLDPSTGIGTCTANTEPVGSWSVSGNYTGDDNYMASSGGATLTVNAIHTTTAITVSPTAVHFGDQVTYSATVTPASGSMVPTGFVVFTDQATSTTLCTALLTAGAGSCTATNAPVSDSDTILGTYTPDTTDFLASTGETTLTVYQPSDGYWLVASDGGVFSYGTAKYFGSMGGIPLNKPIVGMAATADGNGYWMVASDGGLFAFGDAGYYGSMGGKPLNDPIVGMAATGDGKGYWLVASDGGLFAFGDAGYYGSMGGKPLNDPVVGMSATHDGKGYWLVASDGGLFAFGDASFHGSMGGRPLNKPVVGMSTTPGGAGYWLVASDGGLFAFGDAGFYGSMGGRPLNKPVVGMVATAAGTGYWLVASDGGLFAFNAPFYGSTGGLTLAAPVVGMTVN
jgi:hypothetical protein